MTNRSARDVRMQGFASRTTVRDALSGSMLCCVRLKPNPFP